MRDAAPPICCWCCCCRFCCCCRCFSLMITVDSVGFCLDWTRQHRTVRVVVWKPVPKGRRRPQAPLPPHRAIAPFVYNFRSSIILIVHPRGIFFSLVGIFVSCTSRSSLPKIVSAKRYRQEDMSVRVGDRWVDCRRACAFDRNRKVGRLKFGRFPGWRPGNHPTLSPQESDFSGLVTTKQLVLF